MEVRSDWYNRIAKEISLHKDNLSKKDAKKYKLDLLLRVAGRVDDFFSYCGECQLFREDIIQLAQDLGNIIQLPGKYNSKNYTRKINNIVKHLQKQHKLVSEGHYIGIGLAFVKRCCGHEEPLCPYYYGRLSQMFSL